MYCTFYSFSPQKNTNLAAFSQIDVCGAIRVACKYFTELLGEIQAVPILSPTREIYCKQNFSFFSSVIFVSYSFKYEYAKSCQGN